ncbi:MAG: hypothetical protein GWP03_03230 [Proteobacteria bacterium]|nr:hypothetical protein [Pseudomonadota bacterium]
MKTRGVTNLNADKVVRELLNDIVYPLKNIRRYRAYQMILFNKKIKATNYSSSGFSAKFDRFIKDIKNGVYYNCVKCSFTDDKIEIDHKSDITCGNCPLYPIEPEGHVMSVQQYRELRQIK